MHTYASLIEERNYCHRKPVSILQSLLTTKEPEDNVHIPEYDKEVSIQAHSITFEDM